MYFCGYKLAFWQRAAGLFDCMPSSFMHLFCYLGAGPCGPKCAIQSPSGFSRLKSSVILWKCQASKQERNSDCFDRMLLTRAATKSKRAGRQLRRQVPSCCERDGPGKPRRKRGTLPADSRAQSLVTHVRPHTTWYVSRLCIPKQKLCLLH